ncbi:cytochrome P450 [Streptomyces sp. NPDC048514]|uniref:cytochrome P450 n=1 Tax=Streptomyces sp. NPDC048514 TaxID=3365564 RepID=UPI0037159A9C
MNRTVPPPGCPAHRDQGRERLHGAEFAADPEAVYRRLRQHGPAAPVEVFPGIRATLVTSYPAALSVLRSTETFSADPRRWRDLNNGTVAPDNPGVPMMMYRPSCLWNDGEQHARLRAAIADSLDRVEAMALRGYVERVADDLIDRFAARGEADLVTDYARPLPLIVVSELFGAPADFEERLVYGMTGIMEGVDAERANEILATCLAELVALKRAQPGPDVTSWMVAHPAALTDEEMLHQLVIMLGAGTEPLLNLVSNALRLLLSDDRFAGSLSGGSLPVEEALDEVLWNDPPIANFGVHFPLRDVHLGGVLLAEGDPVLISFAAASNDPALATDRRAGNRAHLAWGAGPHTCPAQGFARLIATITVERLLDRLPDLGLAIPADRLSWRQGPFHRALASLPVRFPPEEPRTTATTAQHRAADPAASVPLVEHIGAPSPWTAAAPVSPSTRPDGTSTERRPASTERPRSSLWNSLVRWLRGR